MERSSPCSGVREASGGRAEPAGGSVAVSGLGTPPQAHVSVSCHLRLPPASAHMLGLSERPPGTVHAGQASPPLQPTW